MDWVRTVQLAELLLKSIQANAASQSKAGDNTAMNDQAPTTEPSVATEPTDAQPVVATTPDVATPPPTTDPSVASAPDATTVTALSTAPADPTPAEQGAASDAAALSNLLTSAAPGKGHDTLAIMQSAAQLAKFLSENKDVMAFMSALMEGKPSDPA